MTSHFVWLWKKGLRYLSRFLSPFLLIQIFAKQETRKPEQVFSLLHLSHPHHSSLITHSLQTVFREAHTLSTLQTPLSTCEEDLHKKMGKKSKRSNWNKPKDIPAAVSPAVASPRQVITSTTGVAALDPNQCEQLIATFNQLWESQDWEGALELESEMIVIAKTFESWNPREAGTIHLNLGSAHFKMSRQGRMQQASLHYKKAIELAKRGGWQCCSK